jgi:hypothetical protein
MFNSMEKHYRGFCFQRKYEEIADFAADIERDEENEKAVSWAHLFNEDGDMIATYRRGYGTPKIL